MAKPCPVCGHRSDYPGYTCAACRDAEGWDFRLPPCARRATDWTTVGLRVGGVALIVLVVVWAVV